MHLREKLRSSVIWGQKVIHRLYPASPSKWKQNLINSKPETYIRKQIRIMMILTPGRSVVEYRPRTKRQPSSILYRRNANRHVWFFITGQFITSVSHILIAYFKWSDGKLSAGSFVFQRMFWICYSSCSMLNWTILKEPAEYVQILNLISENAKPNGVVIQVDNWLRFMMANGPFCIFLVTGLNCIYLIRQYGPLNWWNWMPIALAVYIPAWNNAMSGLLVLDTMFASYMIIFEATKNLLSQMKSTPFEAQIRVYRQLQIYTNSVNSCVGGVLPLTIKFVIIFAAVVTSSLLVLPKLRDTTSAIELLVSIYMMVGMLLLEIIVYGYPGRCNGTSFKIKNAWQTQLRKRLERNATWKIDKRIALSCLDIRFYTGILGYYQQNTLAKLLDFYFNATSTLVIILSDLY